MAKFEAICSLRLRNVVVKRAGFGLQLSRSVFPIVICALLCGWADSSAAGTTTIGGVYKSAKSSNLNLIDRRPPVEQRVEKVLTPDGEKDRLDDRVFEQPPIHAIEQALSEQVSDEFVSDNRDTVELLALDVAIGDKRGRAVTFAGTAADPTRARTPIEGVGIALGGALIQMIEDSKGSRPLFISISLANKGKVVSCERVGSIPEDFAAGAWHSALVQAAAKCARQLEIGAGLESRSASPIEVPVPSHNAVR